MVYVGIQQTAFASMFRSDSSPNLPGCEALAVRRRGQAATARMLPHLTLQDAITSRAPALLDKPPWPPPSAFRWTPAYVAERFPLLDPVRHGAKAGVFWNVDRDSAAANSRRAEGGFAFTDSVHEEAAVPTAAFFHSEQPQYFSSSLLDAHGAAHLCSPMHDRMYKRASCIIGHNPMY